MAECDWHGGAKVRHPDECLDRCGSCGHRIVTDGLVPVETRVLALRAGIRAPAVAVTELQRRAWARRTWSDVRRNWAPPGL